MSASPLLVTQCCTCGADIVFPAGIDMVFCEYCDRPNARPVSEATELTLLKYANERLNMGEFDEAAISYRKVLQKNIEEHEARWGLLLCKYGVMYVEDPMGRERLITCRRAVNGSMRTEPDFEICCRQASDAVREAYERDAEYIDRVQAEIRRIRAEGQPYDVFLCYKETAPDGSRTRDSVLAQSICQRMEGKGYRMFYAPKSLKEKSGANYEAAIFAALSDARVMLALGTKPEYFESPWVRSEWKRYLEMIDAGEDKLLVPLYRDMDPAIALPADFRMRYLQALDMDDLEFLYDLEDLLSRVIRQGQPSTPEPGPEPKSDSEQDKLMTALFMLEDGVFDEGTKALKDILSANPKCARAHLGLCMAGLRVRFEADLPRVDALLNQNNSFIRALNFANTEERARWQGYSDAQVARLDREAQEEQAAKLTLAVKPARAAKAMQAVKRQQEEKAERYQNAVSALKACRYDDAIELFQGLGYYKDAIDQKQEAQKLKTACDKARAWKEKFQYVFDNSGRIAAGGSHMIGLKSDGTVIATDGHRRYKNGVNRWTDIVAVAIGDSYTVGLKSDGTVAAIGDNRHGQCDVSGWTDIVAVSVGYYHMVGLKSDGTLAATGDNSHSQCNVQGWTDIVAISAGDFHTTCLKSDGTVAATGFNEDGRCNVGRWTDIVAISAGGGHTVGLRSDGTVVAIGDNKHHQCDVDDWSDIVAVSAGSNHTVGLKSNGTVVAIGYREDSRCATWNWENIVAVSAGGDHTVGLESDGTVVSTDYYSKCLVKNWHLW